VGGLKLLERVIGLFAYKMTKDLLVCLLPYIKRVLSSNLQQFHAAGISVKAAISFCSFARTKMTTLKSDFQILAVGKRYSEVG